ncbi:MAG: hypothetical protein FWG59_03025 [Betaproteobacteria bacterium]|nr:hypothetical protein [Betaproteobacteria bacterium]
MDKNVMIPRSILERIIVLLECMDLSKHPNCYDYYPILWELKVKMQKLELRNAYSKIMSAKSDDAKHEARIEYLRQRSQIGNVDMDFGELPF